MDQIKIGNFIAESRKKHGLTQMQLAEKLNITDRAVSKWENGKSLPDSSIMLDLCKELQISVNELLSGEAIQMEKYNENVEKTMLELVKQKEEADRRLLTLEVLIGSISVIMFIIIVMIAAYSDIPENIQLMFIIPSAVFIFIIAFLLVRIEQVAGYYECAKCHHKYVPTYGSMVLAPHMGRTRYMKCPECGEKSWQRKVISKDDTSVPKNVRPLIIILSVVVILVLTFVVLKIEQVTGYYECSECHYEYVPTYRSMVLSPHKGTTRYMKCPACEQKSWQKKVISK